MSDWVSLMRSELGGCVMLVLVNRKLVIREQAHKYFQKTEIVPARALREELEDQRRAKKNKVGSKPNRKNPSTTCGCAIDSQEIIDEAKMVQNNRTEEIRKAALTKEATAEKKRLKTIETNKVSKEVINHVYMPQINWNTLHKTFKAEQLRIGLQAMVNDKDAGKKKKVHEIVTLIRQKVKGDMAKIYCS